MVINPCKEAAGASPAPTSGTHSPKEPPPTLEGAVSWEGVVGPAAPPSLSPAPTHLTSLLAAAAERFGFSAPGNIVMKELGMTADNLVKEAKAYM